MNQQEIYKEIDKLLAKSESKLEALFARRLKAILTDVSVMFAKYGNGKDPTYTDLNKYGRLQKELNQIAKELTKDYQVVAKEIVKMQQTIFVDNYLMHAYLFEMTEGNVPGFKLPSMSVIREALTNPIEFLTLSRVLEPHRNEIVRKLNIEIAQSLQIGEGYYKMAKRIENAVEFSRKKALLVARTEAARSQSISAEKVAGEAQQYVEMGKVWASSLDLRVRMSHRNLDGQKADTNGYFHHQGIKAKAPCLWNRANMDINCRCIVLYTVNGKLPEYRRGRDYTDSNYQERIAKRTEKIMNDKVLTYLQALKIAQREIQPPSKTFEYVTYDDWKKKYVS